MENKRRRSSTKTSGSGSIDDNHSEDINIDDIDEDDNYNDHDHGKGKDQEDNNDDIVSMDELLDISKLDNKTDDGSLSQEAADDRFTRDLNRWERVPIGAFRLMRAKNRLWLNR